MTIIAYLLAVLNLLFYTLVPLSNRLLLDASGSWGIRLLLFSVWFIAIIPANGDNLRQFARTLIARWAEIGCYLIWVVVLGFFWLLQGGAHYLTDSLMKVYIGAFPLYFMGAYYPVERTAGLRLAVIVGCAVGISCMIAIPVVWQDPELVRQSVVVVVSEIRAQGIPHYGELTGYAVTLPFFIVAAIQSKHVVRLLGIAACVAAFALSLISTLAGIILLAGLAVAACVLYYLLLGGFRWKRILAASAATLIIGWASISVFPRVYERAVIGKFYDKLADTFSSLSRILAGKETDPTHRYTLMLDSLHEFQRSPVIGVGAWAEGIGTEGTGGHSSWMDALANYGLLGGVPYLLFHLLVFRRLWQAWRADPQNALNWGCLCTCGLYLFYGLFNIVAIHTTVVLFLYVIAAGGQRSKVPVSQPSLILVRSVATR